MFKTTFGILAFLLALGVSFSLNAKADDFHSGEYGIYCYNTHGELVAYGVERDFAGVERDFARGVERDFYQERGSVQCYFVPTGY